MGDKQAIELYHALEKLKFPKKLRPGWLKVRKKEDLVVPNSPPTIWDIYEGIMELIFESDSNDKPKERNYKKLHKALRVAKILIWMISLAT